MRGLRFSQVLFVLLLGTVSVLAQTQAVISGVIRDGSGAVIPGATITVTNPATNFVRSAVSNEAGVYSFPALQPGGPAIGASGFHFAGWTGE